MSVQLVPQAVSRGTAASEMKLTIHLPIRSRLRMSGALGLYGMHRDSVMCILHSLSCQDNVVAGFRVLLLKGCNFFFIYFCCTYVAIQPWFETVLLIVRCFNSLNCVVNTWVVCRCAIISCNAQIIVNGWCKFLLALLFEAHSYCV